MLVVDALGRQDQRWRHQATAAIEKILMIWFYSRLIKPTEGLPFSSTLRAAGPAAMSAPAVTKLL
jgi:hypothetical protein